MEKLYELQKQWERQLREGTGLTTHAIYFYDSDANLNYISTFTGVLTRFYSELDETNNVLSVSLDVCIRPFPNKIRKSYPLFKNIHADPLYAGRTIYKDEDGKIYVKILHELNDGMDIYKDSLNIPGVFLGFRCKDTCFRVCDKHYIIEPYSYKRY